MPIKPQNPIDLSRDNILYMYHFQYKPSGSGPLGCMKTICSLLEAIADMKNISLDISEEELERIRNDRQT